jgi:NitT/TauT family transport system substrate-binding protein
MITRRGMLGGATVGLALAAGAARAEAPAVRVGVLKFGTVSWETDVILRHGLDAKHGVALQVTPLTGKDPSAVALQGGAVDLIVTDYIWASRERSAGADYVFAPHSLNVGALMARPGSGVSGLGDLAGRKVGVAGGPVDKSWLLLRAAHLRETGVDLANAAEPVFGAPPLLNELAKRGEIDAVLNFWHFNARLKAAGFEEVVRVADILPALGVARPGPLLGWVFAESWARANPDAIRGFLAASAEAKRILLESDAEWEALREAMRAEDEATFVALRDAYRAGIPTDEGPEQIEAARATYVILAELGGAELIGETPHLAEGVFWSDVGF